jgi:hypothetical protein
MAIAKPKTYAQWLATVSPTEKAWLMRIPYAQRMNAYRTGYLIPFQHGQYGGPQPRAVPSPRYLPGGNVMMMQPPLYPGEGFGPQETQPPITSDPNVQPGTYQGTADGSSPSTMSPTTTALATTGSTTGAAPVAAGFNFMPILLFGGAGIALFLFMRNRKAA